MKHLWSYCISYTVEIVLYQRLKVHTLICIHSRNWSSSDPRWIFINPQSLLCMGSLGRQNKSHCLLIDNEHSHRHTKIIVSFLNFLQLYQTKVTALLCWSTQQNSYSISHYAALWLYGTWLDSYRVVTIANCRQHGDYNAICSSVTVLPAVYNGDCAVTVKSPSRWRME